MTILIGVFVLPVLGLTDLPFKRGAFGLAAVLLAGYPFALAGHYDLFTRGPQAAKNPTTQEETAVAVTASLALLYLMALAAS